jgi:hypothetical protein
METLELKKLLHTVFLRSPENRFDEFIKECQAWYAKPAHTFTEMRVRNNKKIRGDIFEEFCVLYLKEIKGYQNVWRLEDVPEDILQSLSMKRKDMGIDLIVSTDSGFYAVQCKYKAPTARKSSISWSTLSTFYALCLRTGPWAKYIVMTNCDYTKHQGPKTEKDISICLGTLRGITAESWIKLCGIEGHSLAIETSQPKSKEELRELRLMYYSKPVE